MRTSDSERLGVVKAGGGGLRCLPLENVRLDGFLSFPPGSPALRLKPLNVLIGPNGAGKSNFIEAFDLLAATPLDFAAAVRAGGGAEEWPWKGPAGSGRARIEAVLDPGTRTGRPLRYSLEFGAVRRRVEVFDEVVEAAAVARDDDEVSCYYRFGRGDPVIAMRSESGEYSKRRLKKESVRPDQSVLAQRKDPDTYPELTWLGERFREIRTFRDWTFGPSAPLRQSQRADLPGGSLLRDSTNLALVLNHIEHEGGERFIELVKRFLPGVERVSTYVAGGAIDLFLHDSGLTSPIPSVRISDGTLRFMAILATLLDSSPPAVLCIESPELGLHPDAVALLGEILIDASERLQLIVTTHSGSLLDCFTNDCEAIVVCERSGAGTELRRLDSEGLASWLDGRRLGDLWASGVLGANP